MTGFSRNILLSTAMHGLAAVTLVVIASAGRGVGVRAASPSIPVMLVSGAEPMPQPRASQPVAAQPAAPKIISKAKTARRPAEPEPPAVPSEAPLLQPDSPKTAAQTDGSSAGSRGMSIVSGPSAGQSSGASVVTGTPTQTASSIARTASPGGSARIDAVGLIRAAIERTKTYPSAARRRGVEGTAVAEFSIAGNGRPANIRITRSSGSRVLDDAAVETIMKAAPFPAVGGAVEVPIVYRLEK